VDDIGLKCLKDPVSLSYSVNYTFFLGGLQDCHTDAFFIHRITSSMMPSSLWHVQFLN
jgi:hypothetical protein